MSFLPTTMDTLPPTMDTSPSKAADIPDDIWLEIFSLLSASRLRVLERVSTRFRALVARPLLQKILWVKHAQTSQNIEDWRGKNSGFLALPRTATVAVPFQGNLMGLYRAIYRELPKFQSLHTLKLVGTTFGEDMYYALFLPNLHTLAIVDCEFDAEEYRMFSVNFRNLSLRHLKLHNVLVPGDYRENLHPIRLIASGRLISLDITWSATVAMEYDQHIRMPFGIPPPLAPVPAPSLQFLEVRVPMLTRDLLCGLGHLTMPRMITPPPPAATPGNQPAPAPVPVARSPRVTLQVQHWYMTQEQVSELDRVRQMQQNDLVDAVQGVWSYTGPPEILGIFVPLGLGLTNGQEMTSTVGGPGSGDGQEQDDLDEDGGSGFALRHLCLTPPAPESHFLSRLLWAIDTKINPATRNRIKRVKGLYTLEVCLPRWDVEILFAIRAIFVDITSVVIRVGEVVGGEALFVTLGGSILSHMPRLHTLRIIHDPESISAAEAGRNARSGFVSNPGLISIAHTYKYARSKIPEDKREDEAPHRLEQAILVKDYLWGWNRYCHALRTVQLSDGIELQRRWEGGEWEMKHIVKESESDKYWMHGWYYA